MVVLESFQEHKSGIRRKHKEYADETIEDRVLHNTSKRGPPDRPNQPMKTRHRPSNIRTHQAVYQRKAVARGGKVGPAEPMVRPNMDRHLSRCIFAGRLVFILLKSVADVSIQGDGGNRPIQAIKGPSSLSHTTHTT